MSDRPAAVTVREMLAEMVEGDIEELREAVRRAIADDAEIRFGRLAIDFHEVE